MAPGEAFGLQGFLFGALLDPDPRNFGARIGVFGPVVKFGVLQLYRDPYV